MRFPTVTSISSRSAPFSQLDSAHAGHTSEDLGFEVRGFSFRPLDPQRRERNIATIPNNTSRLRRRETHSRFFFITTNLLREKRPFNDGEYEVLATALNRTRKRFPFALCGYCFMPDQVHVIIFPEESTTISDVIKSFKLTAPQLPRRSGDRNSGFWQNRFYDHALRTRKEYDDALAYRHMNLCSAA